jgi:hypothetical protein
MRIDSSSVVSRKQKESVTVLHSPHSHKQQTERKPITNNTKNMLNFDLSKFLKNAKGTTTVPSSNAMIAPKEIHEIGKKISNDPRSITHIQDQSI